MTQWETQTQKTPKERDKTLWFICLWRYRRTNLKPQKVHIVCSINNLEKI